MSKVASDFAVDSNVRSISNKSRRGTVIGNKLSDGDQVIAVEWEDGTLAKANVNDIEVCLSLEEEFKQMQSQVNEKLQQAADLIREANKMAEAHGKNLQSYDDERYDHLFDVGHIEGAMDEAGWNTSSWYC